MSPSPAAEFERFVATDGRRLQHALVARYGPEAGSEATAEAFAYGWEHWDRVREMANPAGFLYRVGQSRSRRLLRRPPKLPAPDEHRELSVEPLLPKYLVSLPGQQRVAVLLVHAFGYTVREAAQILDVNPSTVQQNAARGLAKLRRRLGVRVNA